MPARKAGDDGGPSWPDPRNDSRRSSKVRGTGFESISGGDASKRGGVLTPVDQDRVGQGLPERDREPSFHSDTQAVPGWGKEALLLGGGSRQPFRGGENRT